VTSPHARGSESLDDASPGPRVSTTRGRRSLPLSSTQARVPAAPGDHSFQAKTLAASLPPRTSGNADSRTRAGSGSASATSRVIRWKPRGRRRIRRCCHAGETVLGAGLLRRLPDMLRARRGAACPGCAPPLMPPLPDDSHFELDHVGVIRRGDHDLAVGRAEVVGPAVDRERADLVVVVEVLVVERLVREGEET
jgi:hypothetical protein